MVKSKTNEKLAMEEGHNINVQNSIGFPYSSNKCE